MRIGRVIASAGSRRAALPGAIFFSVALLGGGLLGLLAPGCHRGQTILGCTGACCSNAECAPPATICGADSQCVPGCATDGDGCLGGASCDPSTGECNGPMGAEGASLGQPCSSDADCPAPELVCRPSTMTCIAGCTLDPDACVGRGCDVKTGHCCGPSAPCPGTGSRDGGSLCSTDGDCAGQGGAVICQLGACVPSCATAGCAAPLACAPSGHCEPPSGCARDQDCDGVSYCTQAGSCAPLVDGGRIDCSGGTVVRSSCNQSVDPQAFRACAGAPGPAGCPYCQDGSCYRPGLCDGADGCHRGNACDGGRCRPGPGACAATVSAQSVIDGRYAAGHEVCVRDAVKAFTISPNGNVLLHVGSAGLTAVVTPLYAAVGVARPAVGVTVSLIGPVRWDEWHGHFEMNPVEAIQP